MTLSDRAALRQAFVAASGRSGATLSPLAADASFRSYHRVQYHGEGTVLMDAPPPKEDIRPFCAIAQRLTDLGLSAPTMLSKDPDLGFLLLEDFGNGTFTTLLRQGADETALYDLAVDTLIDLHSKPHAADDLEGYVLPEYTTELYLTEAGLLPDWYAPANGVKLSPEDRVAYDAAWREVLPALEDLPKTLVLRDFHVDNLMQLPGRDGVASCGLLDFQDAVRGPTLYDFMSLMEDARRDIDSALILQMQEKYYNSVQDIEKDKFYEGWAILSAQRHAKVIGIFTRLSARDNKPSYLVHIPRVWRLLENALEHPSLAPVAAWFSMHIPPSVR